MTTQIYKVYQNDTTAGGFTVQQNPLTLTTAERDALTLGASDFLLIYNSTTTKLNFWNGTAWAVVTSV